MSHLLRSHAPISEGGWSEIDGELSYGRTWLDGNAWLGGNLFYRRDPGHFANSPDDVGAAIRFSLSL